MGGGALRPFRAQRKTRYVFGDPGRCPGLFTVGAFSAEIYPAQRRIHEFGGRPLMRRLLQAAEKVAFGASGAEATEESERLTARL